MTPNRASYFAVLSCACASATLVVLVGDVVARKKKRYEEDADLTKAAGFEGFRLSFAWSRIYPEGEGDEPNAEGVAHYHDVIDALLDRGLEPMVTLYHWDLPQVRAGGCWRGA